MDGNLRATEWKGSYTDREQKQSGAWGYEKLRRWQDILLSAVALTVLLPVMAAISLLIWLDDPSISPIYTQTRVGFRGRRFTMYKFRTMYADAEDRLEEILACNEMDGPAFKLRRDPRITRFGKLLRRTSLDELPQLWNVLLGDMSIVGPRPALPRETEQYDAYARRRLSVMPGLTCYWQIRRDRYEMPFSQWLELDLRYIREQSFCTDWKIILGTVAAVFFCTGR